MSAAVSRPSISAPTCRRWRPIIAEIEAGVKALETAPRLRPHVRAGPRAGGPWHLAGDPGAAPQGRQALHQRRHLWLAQRDGAGRRAAAGAPGAAEGPALERAMHSFQLNGPTCDSLDVLPGDVRRCPTIRTKATGSRSTASAPTATALRDAVQRLLSGDAGCRASDAPMRRLDRRRHHRSCRQSISV